MTVTIGRRELLAALGGAAAAWPLAAGAQQAAVPVVGVLSAEWPNLFSDRLRAFHDGLRETGYVEGRNLAARTLGLELHVLHASSEHEIDAAFATLVQLRAGALVIGADALFNSRSEQLAALTICHGVPAIYQFREFVSAGGLMAYGSTVLDTYRPLGVYTGRILKGEKPAELPVQQATKVELVINMKTANVLGLDVPASLLARADEVIE